MAPDSKADGAGLLWKLHRWLAHPIVPMREEEFELYGVTNYAMVAGFASHVGFIPLFLLAGVPVLAAINVLSVASFAIAIALCRRAHQHASMVIGSTEVIAHAWIATLYFGWMSSFHLHAILALELSVLYAYSWVSIRTRLTLALVTAVLYLALMVHASVHEPWVPLTTRSTIAFALINGFIFLGATTGMLAYHTWTVLQTRTARSEAQRQVLERTRLLEEKNEEVLERTRMLEQKNEELLAAEQARALALDVALEARAEAEEASRAKSMFLANMSHELRTPLNAIIGYSEMIAEEAEDEGNDALVDEAGRVCKAGRHLLSLINDILDLSKIEAGRMDVECIDFDVPACVHDVVDTVESLAAKNDNTLDIDIDPAVNQMHSDPTKVRQILYNLLSNACKFTEEGRVSLRVAALGDELEFTVADTGIGMAPELLERIFREFSQADGTTTRRFGGTGLGLTITQRFCELLGGSIAVKSTLGEGSQFVVKLPRRWASTESSRRR